MEVTPNAEENQVEATPAATVQQTQAEVPVQKKRKEIKPKSAVWQFFERVKYEHSVVLKGKCLYCAKKIMLIPKSMAHLP